MGSWHRHLKCHQNVVKIGLTLTHFPRHTRTHTHARTRTHTQTLVKHYYSGKLGKCDFYVQKVLNFTKLVQGKQAQIAR